VYEEDLGAGKAAKDLEQMALSNRGLGRVACGQANFTAARKFLEAALAINRALNDDIYFHKLSILNTYQTGVNRADYTF
jgi:uncharacterized protein HemY